MDATTDPAAPARQPTRFLLAFAAAWSGGAIAYTPFLTLLLPIRWTALAGADDVHWLALSATVGAVASSVSNIGWGWASDRWPSATRRRRPWWTGAGLLATIVATIFIATATQPAALVAAVAAWQVALNLMLAPLSAYAADSIGERQKGTIGGMMSFGPAMAALSVIGVSWVPADLRWQLGLIMAIVAAAVLPLLLMPAAAPMGTVKRANPDCGTARYDHRSLFLLWLARLFVQVAEGLLFVFIFYFLRSVATGDLSLGDFGWTNAGVQLAAIPIALLVGRYCDRSGRRKWPLIAMIGLTATGLGGMALFDRWIAVVGCYALFLMGSNSFLALHSAFTMQQLPDPRHYGRDLGLFNLTNTLPSLTTPLLAALIIGHYGYHALIGLLAVAMLVPAAVLARLRLD